MNEENDAMEKAIKEVISQIPSADTDAVRAEFERYKNSFYIPPADAMRSVLRKFQPSSAPAAGGGGGSTYATPGNSLPNKKVERLSELGAEDKNIVIEVKITTHNRRTQTIRGQEKDIAFGTLEDNPWGEGEKIRWDFKDWGPHQNLVPGAIVRIEGASVNEYQGKRSLNINQSSRIVILQESTQLIVDPDDPITIEEANQADGMVSVVGRVLSRRDNVITKKDGSGTLDVVKGRIADDTGSIGFVSWEPFVHEVGTLLKFSRANIRRFRDTPELNLGRTTNVEVFHDANFADAESLAESSHLTISQLKDGSRDITMVVQLQSLIERKFAGSDGEEKVVMSGEILDPTGRCKCSAWCEMKYSEDELPVTLRLNNVRVRMWQGIPDVTIDNLEQITKLDETPWESIDPDNHVIDVDLNELAAGSSRMGISTEGTVVSVRDDCGVIYRCPECRRVLRDDTCAIHGSVQGNKDIRLRLVIDNGNVTSSLIISSQATLEWLSLDQATFEENLSLDGQAQFVQQLRNDNLGRRVKVGGRCINDNQGMMIIVDKINTVDVDAELAATEARTKWGVA